MTRDEIRGIIEGIGDEQLKRILDINSADIGRAKAGTADLKNSLTEAEKTMAEMSEELESLRNGQREAEEIRKQRDELQKAADQRAEKDRQAAILSRFDTAAGNVRFINDFTRQGVFSQFEKALAQEENQGRSDAEIFGELTKDSENLFFKLADTPEVVASTMGFGGSLTDGDVREIMGLSPQLP